jgi:hypothetical protein
LRTITLSLGVEVGWVLVRQSYATAEQEPYLTVLPASPSFMHPQWSDGVQFGPLAQLDFPLGERAYLRFEAGLPYRQFSEKVALSDPSMQFHRGVHLHIVAGGGISF